MADPFGTLPPDIALEQQRLTRQQQLAGALMQNNQQPQGQMISGRFVAPSFFQNLQPVANMLTGAYLANKSDEGAQKTAQALRDFYKQEAQGFAKAIKENPEEAYITYSSAYNPAIAKTATERMTRGPKWEKAEKLDAKGNTIYGVMDMAASSPESTFRAYGTGKLAVSPAEAARLNWEGIPYGGGSVSNAGSSVVAPTVMPMNNAPVGTSPIIRNNAPAQVSIAPNAPAYAQNAVSMQPNTVNANQLPVVPQVSMAGVSPKKQAEIKGDQLVTLQGNVKNAYEAYPVIKEIQDLLPSSSSGYLQRGWTGTMRGVGVSTDASKADTQLDLLAPKLTMLQPRFEGPQGVLDVKLYESMAGRLADTTLPYEDRIAALEQLKNIYKRYAPNLDWTYSPKPAANPQAKPAAQGNLPSAPAGVDPAIWSVMTPAERSLWQK
jgi:hypothetical protein